jgi:hypothetical protein
LAEEKAPEPHLIFKKSVVVKKYKAGQAYAEPRTVKKGEHLWKILREHYQMANSRIAFYSKIAKAVNPEIKDMDKLYPGQKILVPYKFIKTFQQEIGAASETEHVVMSGEHLFKILRKDYNLPESLIFSSTVVRLITKANPGIDDLNVLEKGQKIIIPAEIMAMSKAIQKEGLTEEEVVKVPDAKPEKSGSGSAKVDIDKVSAEPAALPYVESSQEVRAKDMVSLFTHSFEGTDNRTGKDEISLEGQGTIKLDYAKFPLYDFPWGKKILFDYGNKLPAGAREVIAAQWENAEVVSVHEKDDMESILGKVLDGCGFYKVEKGGEYMINRDNIQLSVSGNWIVFKDSMMKNVFVVNLIKDKQEPMNPELKAYLSSMGLNIVDISTGKKEKAGPVIKKPGEKRKIELQKIKAEPIILTDRILDILGQPYQKDYNTQIFQNIYSGFSLEVMADRMFVKDGSTFLIDFHNLPDRICEIIAEQGFQLLKIDPQKEDLPIVAKKVLDFYGKEYGSSPAKFQYDKDKKSNVRLTIPGFLIKTGSEKVLLTQVELKDAIIQFLSEMDVRIVQY